MGIWDAREEYGFEGNRIISRPSLVTSWVENATGSEL